MKGNYNINVSYGEYNAWGKMTKARGKQKYSVFSFAFIYVRIYDGWGPYSARTRSVNSMW